MHEQTKPVDLDEAFDLAVKATQEALSPVAIPTGLSDEEDAQRHLALRFNPELRYCPNCEVPVVPPNEPHNHWCAYCGDNLRKMGVPARKKKFISR